MKPQCVLVIENHGFQRGVLVKALQSQGVSSILLADNAKQATVLMRGKGSVDIVFFDLNDNPLEILDLWEASAELKRIRALILYGDLQPDISRAMDHMSMLSDTLLLGVLEKPLQMDALRKMLTRFNQVQHVPTPRLPLEPNLLSREEVLRGLALAEFRAWYQPKFNLLDGSLFGAEVLVRWEHPTQGLLLPNDLLAAVLGHGLIDEMLKQLLEQGMELLLKLKARGLKLQLAFNLAASQLNSDEWVESLAQLLRQYELPGSAVMFEVSESGLLELPVSAQDNVHILHRLGCGLSIDDFGVGFSSMRLLARLPFSQLKLDGMFVQDLSSARNRAVVTSSLALAQALGMDVIIEGVSSRFIHDELVRLGCTYGQGFHLALPMDSEDFCAWLEVAQEEKKHI
ncbi:EAL domain-containing response regulator [Pseudomonas sp. GT1P32]